MTTTAEQAERNATAQDAEATAIAKAIADETTRLNTARADRKAAHRMATRKDRPYSHPKGRARLARLDDEIIPAIERRLTALRAEHDHYTADAARLRAYADTLHTTTPAQETPAMPDTAPAVTVTLPGKFCDYMDGTGLAQGQDDSDPECKATRQAYEESRIRRYGRNGYARILTTTSPTVLRVLAEYTAYCEEANADEARNGVAHATEEARAARAAHKRLQAARTELRTAQDAHNAQQAPQGPQEATERPAVDHSACEHRKSLSADHAPTCPVHAEGLTAEHCACHLSDAECERTTPAPAVHPATLTAARLLEGLTVDHRGRTVTAKGHGVRPDGTVTLTLEHINGATYTAPMDDTAVTATDRDTFADRIKAHTTA